jgi:hypothetical protein
MNDDFIKDDTSIEIVEVDKKSYKCRGSLYCKYWDGIPKGQKALRIKTDGAGGWNTAFYCKKCMKPLIAMMKVAIDKIENEE